MKVSKESWHYRFIREWSHNPMPRNLCSYFWTLVSLIILGLFALAGALGVLSGVIIMPASDIYNIIYNNLLFADARWLHIPLVLIAIALVIFIVFCIAWIIFSTRDKIEDMKRSSKRNNRNKHNKPNIAIEFLKAKKRKVCPLINYEE